MSEETTATTTEESLLNPSASEGQEPAAETPQGTENAEESKGEVGDAEKPQAELKPFTVPEGITVDSELLNKATELFKEAGLSQEAGQKLVDLYAGRIAELTKAQTEAYQTQVGEWVKAVKTDAELGGAQFQSRLAVAHQAVRLFGGQELIALLNDSGLGNHPEMVRFAYRVGKALGEGALVQPGAGGKASEEQTLRALYPTMFPPAD